MSWLLLWLSLGWAQQQPQNPPELRSPLFSSEKEAVEFQKVVSGLGYKAELKRSYEHGHGWVYTVWVEGFSTSTEARSAAELLAKHTSQGVSLVEDASPPESLSTPPGELPDAKAIRLRMVRALGGRNGAIESLRAAPSLVTVVERHLPKEDLRARQVYKRVEGRQRLESRSDEVEWLAVSGPSGAWWLRGSELRPVDEGQMGHLLAQGSPETLFAYILDLPRLLLDDEDYLGLELVGQRTVGRRSVLVLAHQTRHGVLEVVVETGSWLPRRVSFSGAAGLTERVFLGWRAVGSQLSLPTVVEVWGQGELWERMRLEEIELSQAFSESDFSPPEMP